MVMLEKYHTLKTSVGTCSEKMASFHWNKTLHKEKENCFSSKAYAGWQFITYFSCLASQSCCMDGTFHCTNSTRQLDKWWARPKGSNPRLTSTWPIQKLLSPPERPRLNWLVSSVFQRHWWLQERIKQYLIFIILFSKLITKDDEWA